MNTMDDHHEGRESICSCKVGRNIDSYDLTHLEDDIVRSWTIGQASVRDLAERVNIAIVDRQLPRNNMEAETVYKTLTDDTVTAGERTEIEQLLKAAEVNPDSLTDDFVSHQTVYRHLTDCHDVSRPDKSISIADRQQEATETIAKLRERTRQVTSSRIEGLKEKGQLAISRPEVFVDVQVMCQDCSEVYATKDLIDRGSCGCDEPE